MADSQLPMRFELEVPADGRIELQLPLPAAKHVTVYIVEEDTVSTDLVAAAQSSVDFWDNPLDDEDWNNA